MASDAPKLAVVVDREIAEEFARWRSVVEPHATILADAFREALSREGQAWEGWQHAPAIVDGRTKACVYHAEDIRCERSPGPWLRRVLVVPMGAKRC